MDILNIDNLGKLPNVETKEVVIKEWNAKVVIRGLTKKMQIDRDWETDQ